MDIIKKTKGKSKAIIIDDDIRKEMKFWKERLKFLTTTNEIREVDKISIYVILNELDEFDQNILIAFYCIANSDGCLLGKLLGVSSQIIQTRIKKIAKYVRSRVNIITSDNSIHN